jgi:hypothetical protein
VAGNLQAKLKAVGEKLKAVWSHSLSPRRHADLGDTMPVLGFRLFKCLGVALIHHDISISLRIGPAGVHVLRISRLPLVYIVMQATCCFTIDQCAKVFRWDA